MVFERTKSSERFGNEDDQLSRSSATVGGQQDELVELLVFSGHLECSVGNRGLRTIGCHQGHRTIGVQRDRRTNSVQRDCRTNSVQRGR